MFLLHSGSDNKIHELKKIKFIKSGFSTYEYDASTWKDSESSNLICEGFSYRMSVGQDGANKMSVVDQDHPPRRGSLFLKSVRILLKIP